MKFDNSGRILRKKGAIFCEKIMKIRQKMPKFEKKGKKIKKIEFFS